MDAHHTERHEQIALVLEKLTASINVLAARLSEAQKKHQETRSLMESAMKTLGYEYSQDAKRWVKKEKLEELRKKD